MVIKSAIPILFLTGAFLFKMIPSFSPSVRSILSFLNDVCFIHPKLPLFSCPPTLFFKDSDFSIKYPFIDGKPLHPFPSMFLSGDSQEDTNGASSSSFSFLLRWIQFKFSVLITFLSLFQMFSHAGAPLNHPPLAIHVYLEC